MQFDLTISADHIRLLQNQAESVGETVEGYLSALVGREGARLYHIERCTPKSARKPARASQDDREAVDFLERVYARLREIMPDSYDRMHLHTEQEWRAYAAASRWRELQEFKRRQPWVKKGEQGDERVSL